jgi:signal transduction histidine kinase
MGIKKTAAASGVTESFVRLTRRLTQVATAPLPGPASGGASASPFAERSSGFYMRASLWMNVTGTIALVIISVLQHWWVGLAVALLPAAVVGYALVRRGTRTSVTSGLLADITVMGISLAVIGIPTVAALLAVVMVFLAAILLDRKSALFVAVYILAWTATAYVTDALRTQPTEPAMNIVPWMAAGILFAVAVVLVVSRQVVELIAELEIVRAEFLGGIVHDLRNSLSGVIGAAAVLQETGVDLTEEEAGEMVDIVLGQAAEAGRMVEDLLISSRLDASSVVVEMRNIDVGNLVQETLTMMGTTGVRVAVGFVMPDKPIIASGDQMRVRQITQNLVSNAIRYGGGDVRVTIEHRLDAVAVQVMDNGPGIAPEDQQSLFSPFTRAKQGRRVESSVGLGLSVSRRMARLMGGDLTYRRVDAESLFELTVPVAQTSASPQTTGGERRGEVITTDVAAVWLGDDGVLRVDYGLARGTDTLEHATTVAEACASISRGLKPPMLVNTGGLRPDSGARKVYVREFPTITDMVAIVVEAAPVTTGFANLIVKRLGGDISMRVFDNQIDALAWLTQEPRPDARPVREPNAASDDSSEHRSHEAEDSSRTAA